VRRIAFPRRTPFSDFVKLDPDEVVIRELTLNSFVKCFTLRRPEREYKIPSVGRRLGRVFREGTMKVTIAAEAPASCMQDSPSQTFPWAALWLIARVLLIVGLVCRGLRAFLSPAEASWTAFVLGILIWVCAAAL
jgi:hypothetical protein